MTAEIAVMNREAIALASDSAVTMTGTSGEKIFTSANKLFTLSKYHPVGIMIYGSAVFMGVPWETIIKVYRNKLGSRSYVTLKQYAHSFVDFLDSRNPLFPGAVQEDYLKTSVFGFLNFIKDTIEKSVHSKIDEKGEITGQEIDQIVSRIIKEQYETWEKAQNIPSIPKTFSNRVVNKYRRFIDDAVRQTFEKLPLTKSQSNQLRRIAGNLFCKFPRGIFKEEISGVVVAGYGTRDIFPSLVSYHMEGVVEDRLKFQQQMDSKIDFGTSASIVPFAQAEMVATFMEGIDPVYRGIEESYLSRLLGDFVGIIVDKIEQYTALQKKKLKDRLLAITNQILEDHRKKLVDYRRDKYVNPITSVVSMLPKDELAAMAESLVNLTSFKRKVSMERETVGGPIDVAVISKGDGELARV